MSSELYEAWEKCNHMLESQEQGTCPLYVFWYASVILETLEEMKKFTKAAMPAKINTKSDFYPRKKMHPGKKDPGGVAVAGTKKPMGADSLRKFAKTALGSAQGEIMSKAEMERVVNEYGYKHNSYVGGKSKQGFIKDAIRNNHPVIFAFLFEGKLSGPGVQLSKENNPLSRANEAGPHFSLIIDIEADNYICVNPHNPKKKEVWNQFMVVKSNTYVDNFQCPRYWVKKTKDKTDGANRLVPVNRLSFLSKDKTHLEKYDVKRTQRLNNLVIEIWK